MASISHIAGRFMKLNSITINSLRPLCLTPQNCVGKVNLFNLNFDRRIKKDYKESIKYMESDTFREIYGGELVWKLFRRNHKAHIPRYKSRMNCINEEGFLDTSYPCPICRDEYLILHHENTKLLEQFIEPATGRVLNVRDHHLCWKQYRNLKIAIERAKDIGTLTFEVPDRLYDYKMYYGDFDEDTSQTIITSPSEETRC